MMKLREVLRDFFPYFLAIIVGFIFGAVVFLVLGIDPVKAYSVLFKGALGDMWGITETLLKMIPLTIIGTGLIIAFKCKILNIGGEGQLYSGALLASWIILNIRSMPAFIFIPLVMSAGFFGGLICGLIPAILRVKFEADEIISTLMMNFIVLLISDFLLRGPMSDPSLPGVEQTAVFPPEARFPVLIAGTRLHAGIIIAIICVILAEILIKRTPTGYKIRATGENIKAARFGGINVNKYIFVTLLLSGGLAGLAGAVEVSGVYGRLIGGFSPGYGYLAIAVALFARLSPIGVLLSSAFFSILITGGGALQYEMGVPIYLANVLTAVIIIFVICSELIRYRWR